MVLVATHEDRKEFWLWLIFGPVNIEWIDAVAVKRAQQFITGEDTRRIVEAAKIFRFKATEHVRGKASLPWIKSLDIREHECPARNLPRLE